MVVFGGLQEDPIATNVKFVAQVRQFDYKGPKQVLQLTWHRSQ
jgi:hypothetical protein